MIENKTKKGFTIIEVVLVLAIAGMIFMMVFLGLPALQRSQRDLARKNDARNLIAAIDTYRANNRGKLPENTNNDAWEKIEKYWQPSGNLKEVDPNLPDNHIDDFGLIWGNSEQPVRGTLNSSSRTKEAGSWYLAFGVTCSQLPEGGWIFRYGGKSLPRRNIGMLVMLESVSTSQGYSYCIDLNSAQ